MYYFSPTGEMTKEEFIEEFQELYPKSLFPKND